MADVLNFKIPMHAVDLELDMGSERFSVEDVMDVTEVTPVGLSSTLQELGDALLEDGDSWTNVTSNYVFDKLYSMTKFWGDLKDDLRQEFMSVVTGGLNAVITAVRKAGDDQDDMATRRNAFKMFVFLVCEAAIGTAAPEAASKATSSTKAPAKQSKYVMSAVTALLKGADAPFGRMWDLGVAEEEFAALFGKTAFKVVASSPLMRSKALKAECIELAALAMHKFPTQVASTVVSVIHLLQASEHTTSIVADVLHKLVDAHGDEKMLAATLRELGNIDTSENRDSAGLRNVSTFMVDLSQRAPLAFLRHLETVMPHLEGEAYLLRSAVVACLGNVVSASQSPSEADAAKVAETREVLLDCMQERVFDVHAFTRAAVLRAWSKLLMDGGIPLERYHTVTEFTAGRLSDKAAVVRKTAMQLLTDLLLRNPFAPKLDIAMFQQQVEGETKWLTEHEPKAKPAVDAMPTIGEDAEEEEEEEESEEESEEEAAAGVEETKEDVKEEGTTEEMAEYTKHFAFRAFCMAALSFTKQLAASVPTVCQLMGSKTATDAVAAMRFLAHATTFSLSGCKEGLQKMLTLVWSGDKSVRDAVLATFTSLYITKPAGKDTVPQTPAEVASNLVGLVAGSSLAVTTSMEEILAVLTASGQVTPAVFKSLWGMDRLVEDDADGAAAIRAQCRGAMCVLAMIARAKPEVADCALGFAKIEDVLARSRDYRLARHACSALRVFAKAEGEQTLARQAEVENLLVHAAAMVQGDWHDDSHPEDATFYFGASEEALAAVFELSPRPEDACEAIIRNMTRGMLLGADADVSCVPRARLAQMFFVVGHVAMKLLLHAEKLTSKVKRLRSKAVDERTSGTGHVESKDAIEEELGLAAAAEEADTEMMAEIADKHIVGRNLLGVFGPLIVRVVANEDNKYSDGDGDDMLLQSAVLALCKFMAISSEFCSRHLQVLFTVLQNSQQASLRATISIALGDLASRFPNLIEPWTPHLYARLRDKELRVRKNTLMVLTHLILNDMVKVKGQIAEIAVCLEDEEPRIRDLTRLFFHELSKRGNNPVYNLLPDTLGCLSVHESLTKTSFRSIMKYLLGFIRRDKQSENLMDKLCHRFQTTDDVAQWRELAFCLAQLQTSEKGTRKVVDGFRLYKHTLTDEDVFDTMRGIAAKMKKTAKVELRDAVIEWERNLIDAHGRGGSLEEAGEEAPVAAEVSTSA